MRTISISFAAIVFLAVATPTKAFEIQRIGTDKQYAWVDNGWNHDTECIEVRFATAIDIAPSKLFLKAYFFDGDGKRVFMRGKPSEISDLESNTSSMPRSIKAGEKYTVYFAIPEKFEKGAKKWRRVVIVLGTKEGVTAKVYPKDDIENFDFPEKSKLKQ